MVQTAGRMSHQKYARVVFDWAESYQSEELVNQTTGTLWRWILNRPGCNVAALNTGVAPLGSLTERPCFSSANNTGTGHQPYLWDQISSDFDEYRIYGAKWTLYLTNTNGPPTDAEAAGGSDRMQNISVIVGVSQLMHETSGTDLNMSTNHLLNVGAYREGRDPAFKSLQLKPLESKSVSGYVDMKKFLRRGFYGNVNEMVEEYPWYKAAATPTETTTIGDEDQNQPYYGWGSADVSNVYQNETDTTWVTATYGRAPQCCFLNLMAAGEYTANLHNLRIGIHVKLYCEFRRNDPIYDQS